MPLRSILIPHRFCEQHRRLPQEQGAAGLLPSCRVPELLSCLVIEMDVELFIPLTLRCPHLWCGNSILITPESYLFLPSNNYGDDENLWRQLIRTSETLEYDIHPEHTLNIAPACSILDTVTIASSTSYIPGPQPGHLCWLLLTELFSTHSKKHEGCDARLLPESAEKNLRP
ncbi:hypothetical protein VNO77_03757 [Canavalia gladiata]|uniref:Uncharacterized protein n=1 Tax=Canavalia gladiata TaxID=3824 RepID=A0AAN9RCJ1_CANGL